MPSKPRKPSGPASPISSRKATPTTTVGSTNGTSSSARSRPPAAELAPVQQVRRRHAEQHRATPSPTADDQTVNQMTRCTRGRASTSSDRAGVELAVGPEALGEHPAAPAARRRRRAPDGERHRGQAEQASHAAVIVELIAR